MAQDYVRVRQDGVEFTTIRTAVKKDMKVLDDHDAVDKTGRPLAPVSNKKRSSTSSKSGSGSAASNEAKEATK